MQHPILIAVVLVGALAASAGPAVAQSQGDLWRTFAGSLDPGTEVRLRLSDGQRFRATLVSARNDALLVQPKTRVPVPVQPVPWETIVVLERDTRNGTSGTRAAIIGIATGAGTFLGLLLLLFAAVD